MSRNEALMFYDSYPADRIVWSTSAGVVKLKSNVWKNKQPAEAGSENKNT